MSEQIELLPCPFCGGEATAIMNTSLDVMCHDFINPDCPGATVVANVKQWNTRADPLTELERRVISTAIEWYESRMQDDHLLTDAVEALIEARKEKTAGRTFNLSDGTLGCGECCNGDRCDDPTHWRRDECPYCNGTGQIDSTEKAKQHG